MVEKYGSESEGWGDSDEWDQAMDDYGEESKPPEMKRIVSQTEAASVSAFGVGGSAGMFFKFICSDQI